jgi:excisionase family DNA binding protein
VTDEAADASTPLLKAEDVAKRLNVPKTWVYHAAREGMLPCIRAGRHVRFEASAVERFITEGGTAGTE